MIATKLLTLPSGATCKVRPFIARDWLRRGSIPEIKANPGDVEATAANVDPKFVFELQTIALTACCGVIVHKDGRRQKIVDKPFDEVSRPDELSIELVDQADADLIISEVYALSGFGRGGEAEKAAPFPAQPQGTGEP